MMQSTLIAGRLGNVIGALVTDLVKCFIVSTFKKLQLTGVDTHY